MILAGRIFIDHPGSYRDPIKICVPSI